jgi:hypothetical protein
MPRSQVCHAKCDRLGVVDDLDRGVATIGGDDDSQVTALCGWQRIFTSVTATRARLTPVVLSGAGNSSVPDGETSYCAAPVFHRATRRVATQRT